MRVKTTEVALGGDQETIIRLATQDQSIHRQILRDRQLYSRDAERISLFREYADGSHRLVLTDDIKRILEGIIEAEFCDNVCHQIIAEANGRLRLLEWTCEDETTNEWLEDLFTTSELLARSVQIHYDMLRDGNHAVGVSWENEGQNVCIYREPWWDGIEGVWVAYNAVDKPVFAVKDWRVQTVDLQVVIRRTIFYAERFERYISHDMGASFVPFILPEDNNVWPMPWLDLDEQPLGIPYIHFPNAGRGTGNYGHSELSGGVTGFQDQINDLQYGASGNARYSGFKILTIAGIELKIDPQTGKAIGPDASPGTILTSENADTQFGSIEPGSVDTIKSTYLMKLQAVSRMTRTPLHSITGGDWPSGEALARAEQPAVNKADEQASKLRDCWSQVGVMAVKLWNRFSNGSTLNVDIENSQIGTRFGPTERRDPISRSIVSKNLRDGVGGPIISRMESRRIMGYDDVQAQKIEEELQAEQKADAETNAIRFSRGVGFLPDGTETQTGENGNLTPPAPGDTPEAVDKAQTANQ